MGPFHNKLVSPQSIASVQAAARADSIGVDNVAPRRSFSIRLGAPNANAKPTRKACSSTALGPDWYES